MKNRTHFTRMRVLSPLAEKQNVTFTETESNNYTVYTATIYTDYGFTPDEFTKIRFTIDGVEYICAPNKINDLNNYYSIICIGNPIIYYGKGASRNNANYPHFFIELGQGMAKIYLDYINKTTYEVSLDWIEYEDNTRLNKEFLPIFDIKFQMINGQLSTNHEFMDVIQAYYNNMKINCSLDYYYTDGSGNNKQSLCTLIPNVRMNSGTGLDKITGLDCHGVIDIDGEISFLTIQLNNEDELLFSTRVLFEAVSPN